MSLSKPIYDLLTSYMINLYNNPIRTKSLTSCVITSTGNLASQYISGAKAINTNSLFAYALFGLCFGGAVPHYFYLFLEKTVSRKSSNAVLKKLLLERFLFAPFYQALSLYMIPRLEGKPHNVAVNQLKSLYSSVLQANWKWLTICQLINLRFVPPMLQVLVANFIGFFWVIYLANKRRIHQQKQNKASSSDKN